MTLSHLLFSQVVYQFQQLEKSFFLSDRSVQRSTGQQIPLTSRDSAGLSTSKDRPQALEHNLLLTLCRSESCQPTVLICKNSTPLPHHTNENLLKRHIFSLQITNTGYEELPFPAICCLALGLAVPVSPGSCCCECHSSVL